MRLTIFLAFVDMTSPALRNVADYRNTTIEPYGILCQDIFHNRLTVSRWSGEDMAILMIGQPLFFEILRVLHLVRTRNEHYCIVVQRFTFR